ncbi:hypothetical protein INR49_019578 [Caranx melampygus]|nr:hypothetical protein INR49_019578 [Caranx melampygus]
MLDTLESPARCFCQLSLSTGDGWRMWCLGVLLSHIAPTPKSTPPTGGSGPCGALAYYIDLLSLS